MEQRHIDEAVKGNYESLGPSYFSARETAEKFMDGFEAEQFKPLLKKFTQAFMDEMWKKVEFSLLSDTQANLHGAIWRDVDAIVEAILGGEQWVFKRYVLPERYNVEKIRETVAKLIPKELQEARIADLEKENRDLKSTLESYRRNY